MHKNPLSHWLTTFFFSKISARGFGLMRIAWSATALSYLLMQWKDVLFYYSEDGLVPMDILFRFTRSAYRFSFLDTMGDPHSVLLLYWILLGALALTMFGIATRWSLTVSVLLLFSFHERNPLVLGGGDTLLRNIGFILLISPVISAYSIDRLGMQWANFKKKGTLLPAPSMSSWPYRLLLWQMILLYWTSLWHKFMGTMWLSGTAVAAVFHHPVFTRLPREFMDILSGGSFIFSWLVMLFHLGWVLLLVPKSWTSWIPLSFPLKRTLLLAGVFFHGGILILLDAHSFALVVFAAYLGLLLKEDFAAIHRFWNGNFRGKIAVLFDGHCGLCKRSIFSLQLIDALSRLSYIDFWDTAKRKNIAPDLKEKDLNKAMHVRFPDGRTFKGFAGFRALACNIPLLIPIAPFLFLPGISHMGNFVYARIAERRKKCSHEGCSL